MIPRHGISFDVGEAISFLRSGATAPKLSDFEKLSADALGVSAVVALPSVRSGIHLVTLAAGGPRATVIAPSYTCYTVHQALALSGATIKLIDSAPGAFLMPTDAVCTAAGPGCALVLSELYGIPYDYEALRNGCKGRPLVRILDLAMSIPDPERMRRLENNDIALFSFGWGKPMFAGWGGIACFQDPELAGRVREERDLRTKAESPGVGLRHGSSLLLRAAMNERTVYGLFHQRHLYRFCKRALSVRMHSSPQNFPTSGGRTERHVDAGHPLPAQWSRPMTALNRKLALHNLRNAWQCAAIRRSQAEIYSACLVESGIVRGPEGKALPQSHFPILVPPAVRDLVCHHLRGRGVDTGTLFPFAPGLDRAHYRHAAETSDQVITLPLGPAITSDEVRVIAGFVKDILWTFGL